MKKLLFTVILFFIFLNPIYAQNNYNAISASMSAVFTDVTYTNKISKDLNLNTSLGAGYGFIKNSFLIEIPLTLGITISKELNEYVPNEKGRLQASLGGGIFQLTNFDTYYNIFLSLNGECEYHIDEKNSIIMKTFTFLYGHSFGDRGLGNDFFDENTTLESYFTILASIPIASLSLGYKYYF